MALSQKEKRDSGKIIVQDVDISDTVEEQEFKISPTRIKTRFKTLEGWLSNIDHNEKPTKHISEFEFNFIESGGKYTLYLIGKNTYKKSDSHTVIRIEFEPANMYFKLSNSEYKNLNRQQLAEKLTSKLKEFTKTEEFKTSFLSDADIISLAFNGAIIWSK